MYPDRRTVNDRDTSIILCIDKHKSIYLLYIKGYTHKHIHLEKCTHEVNSDGEARLDTIQFLMSLLQMSQAAA